MTPNEAVPARSRSGGAVDRILIGLFLLLMTLPALDSILHIDPSPTTVEKSPPPAFPRLDRPVTPGTLNRFWKGSKAYLAGNFGFRRSLLRLCNVAELRLFGRFSTETVLPGNEGWLFFNDKASLVRPGRLSEGELAKWRAALVERQDQCRRRGIRYLFVLAPDPKTIYPEYLPGFLPDPLGPSRGAQLIDELAKRPGVEFLDLSGPVREGRALGRLYHRTDTHWNDLGAYCGYRAIMSRFVGLVPGMEPAPLDRFEVREDEEMGGDIAGMIALRLEFPERDVRLIPRQPRRARTPAGRPLTPDYINPEVRTSIVTEIPGSTQPRAVVVRDSFAIALTPFLSEHFSRVVYEYRTDDKGSHAFPIDLIDRERPAVVIDEFAERTISPEAPLNPVFRESAGR